MRDIGNYITESTTDFRFEVHRLDGYAPIDPVRSQQLCVLTAALRLLRGGRKITASAQSAGRLLVPYCAHQMKLSNRRILVNRAYKPLGLGGTWSDYESEVRWHIPESFVDALGLEQGYFFTDWNSPFHGGCRELSRRVECLLELIMTSEPYPWSSEPQRDEHG